MADPLGGTNPWIQPPTPFIVGGLPEATQCLPIYRAALLDFLQSGKVTITARSRDSDGRITQVAFYHNNALVATDHTPAPGQKITITASTASTEDFLNPWVGIYNLGRGDMIGDLGNYPAIEDLQKSGDFGYGDTISGSYTIPAATPLGLYTFRADFQDASGQRGVAWLVVDVGGQSANPPLTYQPPSATSTPPGSLPPNDPGSLPPYDDPLYGDPLYDDPLDGDPIYGDPLYGPSDTYLPQVVSQPLWTNPPQFTWQSLYTGYGPEDLEPPPDDPYWADGGYYP